MEEDQGQQQIIELKKKLADTSASLHITRVPRATKDTFTEIANTEFCGDYGMALKWFVDGLMGKDATVLLGEIKMLEQRIAALEQKTVPQQEPTKRTIRFLDGSKGKGE